MRVLFVVATDLSDNNSAAMCHSAYIRGMMEAGYDVDVVTAKAIAGKINGRIHGVTYFDYADDNLVVRLIRRHRQRSSSFTENMSIKSEVSKTENGMINFKDKIYQIALKYIGAVPTLKRRMLKFRSSKEYDLVVSLSSPATSHEVAAELIRKGNVSTKYSCQIWEDPWATDLYGGFDEALLQSERNILALAEKVIYVTPLTLENQKKLFPEMADKMDWLPLPTYTSAETEYVEHESKTYGYFGQYYPHVRNLQPFYEALKRTNRKGIFCGEPSNLFEGTSNIEINPRLSLEELSVKENQTDVMVCVSNLGGGQIPGKIYQYSASVKPILFILDGSEREQNIIHNYFSKFNRYVFAQNNVEDIARVMKLIEDDWHLYEGIEYFSALNICQEIIKIVCK